MRHWLLKNLNEARKQALHQVARGYSESAVDVDVELIGRVAEALELAVLDIAADSTADAALQKDLQAAAADAFDLFRSLPWPSEPLEKAMLILRMSVLAVLGNRGDVAQWLRANHLPSLSVETDDWHQYTWATVLNCWVRLIRNDEQDRNKVLADITRLREAQPKFEKDYLARLAPSHAKAVALELIGLYHLIKAAEVFAEHTADSAKGRKDKTHELLTTHFDHTLAVCARAQMIKLEPLTRLLKEGVTQLVAQPVDNAPEVKFGLSNLATQA